MKPNTIERTVEPGSISLSDLLSADKVGFITGTIVLTMNGEMPVETLMVGDRIISRNAGMARLIGIRQTRQVVQAISFAAGSLGHTRPEQGITLPGDQQILIRDWRASAIFREQQSLVCARDLIDGEFICDLGMTEMVLYQLQFETPQVVYAGGLEAASISTRSQMDLQPAA